MILLTKWKVGHGGIGALRNMHIPQRTMAGTREEQLETNPKRHTPPLKISAMQ